MSDDPLNDLSKISEPVTALINRVSDAVGGAFKPWQIKRVAKAEAEANVLLTKSRVESLTLEQRAMSRFVYEETGKQKNIEDITRKALPLLDKEAKPDEIEEDWIINFFDKSRLTSDDEMQQLWAGILAGEANRPGSFSKRTVNLMSSLDKEDAVKFSKLCKFNWSVDSQYPLIFDTRADIYNDHGINFAVLKHLQSIGLIVISDIASYEIGSLGKRTNVSYQESQFLLEFPKDQDNILPTGKVFLTSVGKELAVLGEVEKVVDFEEYVLRKWIKKGIKPSSILRK